VAVAASVVDIAGFEPSPAGLVEIETHGGLDIFAGSVEGVVVVVASAVGLEGCFGAAGVAGIAVVSESVDIVAWRIAVVGNVEDCWLGVFEYGPLQNLLLKDKYEIDIPCTRGADTILGSCAREAGTI
jgi:hypothetical protein